MSTKTTRLRWFSRFLKSLAVATLSFAALGTSAPAFAQEKSEQTFAERAREYRDKIVASMESTAKAAGDEYHKLRSEATKASRPRPREAGRRDGNPQHEVGGRSREARREP